MLRTTGSNVGSIVRDASGLFIISNDIVFGKQSVLTLTQRRCLLGKLLQAESIHYSRCFKVWR
jgi:hypothetical protein